MNEERQTSCFLLRKLKFKEVKVATDVSCAFRWSVSPRITDVEVVTKLSSRIRLAASGASRGKTFFKILMFTLIPSLLIQNSRGWGLDIYVL